VRQLTLQKAQGAPYGGHKNKPSRRKKTRQTNQKAKDQSNYKQRQIEHNHISNAKPSSLPQKPPEKYTQTPQVCNRCTQPKQSRQNHKTAKAERENISSNIHNGER
jgi:hypothetical protein